MRLYGPQDPRSTPVISNTYPRNSNRPVTITHTRPCRVCYAQIMTIQMPRFTTVFSNGPEEWQLAANLLGTDGTEVEPGDLFLYEDDFWEAIGLVTKNGVPIGYSCLRHPAFHADSEAQQADARKD